jgi:hypothetical protein
MPRPPKEGSRRNNPDYSPVTAQIPKGLGKRLRLFVTQKETTISEVVEKALAEYLDRNQVQVSVLQPNSIGEVVRQNFWTLREHNIKNIDAIAKGAAPTKADIVEISSILDFDQGELLRLAMSEFGELPKAKPKDTEPS